MTARTFRQAWQMSSVFVKLGIIVLGLALLAALAVGTNSWFQSRAYEKREAAREAERQQLETEKAKLEIEKQQALTEAAEANARADTYKQVAESKRADRSTTLRELEQIERQYEQRKSEIEAAGGSLSDDALRRLLCEKLSKRPGYKACD